MATYYLESSAFAKLFHDEPGTGFIHDLLTAREHDVYVTPLCIVEICSSVARRVRAGELGPKDLESLTACITQDLQEALYRLLPLHDGVYTRATTVLKSVGTTVLLRSLDAIHLAAALELRDQATDTVVVSSDARILTVAEAAGMPFLDPMRA